jgi:hypothetical protein
MKSHSKRSPGVDAGRRAFLTSAATLPAATAVAGVLPEWPAAVSRVEEAECGSRTASRYRASEHVCTYYRTASF